jgi:hypothetical protein
MLILLVYSQVNLKLAGLSPYFQGVLIHLLIYFSRKNSFDLIMFLEMIQTWPMIVFWEI